MQPIFLVANISFRRYVLSSIQFVADKFSDQYWGVLRNWFRFDITETGTEGSFETIRKKGFISVLSEYPETGTFRFSQKRAERTEIARRQRDIGKGKEKRGEWGGECKGWGRGSG